MSMAAALKAERAVSLARDVIAIEMLCACQAIDLLAPLSTSPALATVHQLVRSRVPTLDEDRSTSTDITAIAELIETRALEDVCDGRVK
jgi:histidine ammonia-lyase